MKKTLLAITATLAVTALPTIVHAEDASPFSANVSLTTDYRYRGISQTRLKPALQGGLDYNHPSGFYVGTWLSTISWIRDAGNINGADVGGANVEMDIYGGYKGEIAKDFSSDVGVLTYFYPGSKLGDVAGFKTANTTEVYGALTYGPATVKYSHSVSTLFGFVDSRNSGYLEAAATFDLGNGFSVTPHVGYQKVSGNSDFSYTDYSVTGAKDFDGFVVSLAIVGTDTKSIPANPNGYAYFSPDGKNLGKTTVVLGLKKTF